MKKTIFLAIMLVSGIAFGQNYQSSDAELDASLKIVNTNGNKDLASFKLNLTKTFNVTLQEVEACFNAGMDAGDAFMMCQFSKIINRSIEDVLPVYINSRPKGWVAIVKELGVQPGSAEFLALKEKVQDKSKSNSGNSN
jgi:hypothetical protein